MESNSQLAFTSSFYEIRQMRWVAIFSNFGVFAVLEIPPVESAEIAVRVQIVKDI